MDVQGKLVRLWGKEKDRTTLYDGFNFGRGDGIRERAWRREVYRGGGGVRGREGEKD